MAKPEKRKGKEKAQEKAAARRKNHMIIAAVAIVAIVIAGVAVYLAMFGPSAVAASGDTVSVIYTGMYENKTVFDTNVNKTPLSFIIGADQMIPGFEAAVIGMKVNEKKTVTIPYDQAYGAYNPALVQTIPKSKFPANETITPGEQFYFQSSVDGSTRVVKIVNVTDAGITVDANSPLAGQNLTFDIQVASIKKGNSTANATATS